MPRKVFSAGETLLASDVNTYLANQSVMVFDDAAARTTAIPSPIEGMVTYVKDLDLVQVWDGSEWDEVSGGGSITVSGSAPVDPEAGDLWFYSDTGQTFVYYTDADSSQWIEIGQVGGLAAATIVTSSTRPSNPIAGQLIFETDTGSSFVWDGDSWEPAGGGGGNVANDAIQPNFNTISDSYTFETGYNGVSAGPITIESGATVTVPSGSAWSIV